MTAVLLIIAVAMLLRLNWGPMGGDFSIGGAGTGAVIGGVLGGPLGGLLGMNYDAQKKAQQDADDAIAANQALTQVRNTSPAEVIVSYYLGLIALEQQRNADALRELQRYATEDALGARERGVSQLLTLLTSAALQMPGCHHGSAVLANRHLLRTGRLKG